MIDFTSLDKEIEEKSQRSIDTEKLVRLVIGSNKCEFNKEEIEFDISLLLKEGIIAASGDKIELSEAPLLYYISLNEFYKQFEYKLSDDVADLFVFLDKIYKYFIPKPHHGKSRFTTGINSVALWQQHQMYHSSFDSFLSTAKKEPGDSFYVFSRALSKIFLSLEHDAETILRLVTSLYNLHEFDKPDVQNLNIADLNQGIIQFAEVQPKKAKQLFTLIQPDFTLLHETLSIPLLAGLRENDPEYLQDLEILSKEEKYHVAIVCSLSAGKPISKKDISQIIDLVKKIKNPSKKYRQQLARLYVNVLRHPDLDNNDIRKDCWRELTLLACDNDADIVLSVIQILSIIKGEEQAKSQLLIECVSQDHFNANLVQVIGHTFFKFKDRDPYFDFLKVYATKYRFKADERIYSNTAQYVREHNPTQFDKRLIELAIDNNPVIRWLGERLISYLSFHRGVRNFAVDITKLPARDQFKLFTSVLSDYHEPMYTVPFLLPLLSSENEVVKEGLICRLEMLAEDYGSAVTEAMKTGWREMNADQETIFKRVERYMLKFSEQLSKKNNIKELNPWYTQSAHFNSYLDLHRTLFSRKMEQHIDEHSIFSQLATTVVLAKGGGWKHESKEEVSQLSSFSTSMTLPRKYFISPDNFDWDRKMEIYEDWSNFFEGWEATI
jgi:hypothetical protein